MDIESALRQVRDDLGAAERKLSDAQAVVDKLRAASTGLEYALSVYGDSPRKISSGAAAVPTPPAVADAAELSSWLVLNKEKQSLRALTEIGGNCTTRAVHDKMTSVGLDVDPRAVKGYLNSLKRKGLVVSVGNGIWAVPDPAPASDEPSNDFGPADEAGPKEAREDDVPIQGTVLTGAFGASQPAR